jgi:methionyl aminopeptidase
MLTSVKNSSEIAAMRESGRMLATVLQMLKKQTAIGMSTKDLANIATSELKKLGGLPAFLGYQGFPDVLCTSINQEVVHGIPSMNRILQAGDIVSLDFGVIYKGMITDGAISFIVGKPKSQKYVDLVKYTEQSLLEGIATVKNGVRTGDIGAAIERELNKHHYGIVRDLVGHGVGHELHEDPNIPNYGRANTGERLKKHMTVAIEPMSTLGSDRVYIANDGWTVVTWDDSWSAHFEHTVLIGDNDAEILTVV